MSHKRKHRRLIGAVTSAAWAITEPALQEILEVVTGQSSSPEVLALLQRLENEQGEPGGATPEAIGAGYSRPLDGTQHVTVRDGVATIPIIGKMFRYGNLMTAFSGCTSYEAIAADFLVAARDPGVRAILLAIDSPGGEVNGCLDLATLMATQKGDKPLTAHISGQGCSAAYVLASVADEIVVSSMALVGCLGTAFEIKDFSEAERAAGIRTYRIVSSQTPNKGLDPGTPEGRAQVQRIADAFSEQMLEDVARYRGMTVEALLAGADRGDVVVGAAAVAAGLADRVATYEDVHAVLEGRTTWTPPEEPEGPDNPAPDTPPEEGKMEVKDLTQEALAAGNPQLLASITAAAAAAERARYAAIAALPAAGVEEVQATCLNDPSCTADAAARKILEAQAAKAQQQGAQRVQALRGDEAALEAPAPLAAEAADPASDRSRVSAILAVHQSLGGRVALPASTDRRSA
jgi:ClpP class serine protease